MTRKGSKASTGLFRTHTSRISQKTSQISNISPKISIKNLYSKAILPSKASSIIRPRKFSTTIVNPITRTGPLLEQFQCIKNTVGKAIKEHKTFTVCGNYATIRRALLDRGWVEKMRISLNSNDALKKLNMLPIQALQQEIGDKIHGPTCKRLIMSKLLGINHQVDFYWDYFNDAYKVNNDKIKYTLINKLGPGASSYTSKRGLCESIKQAHWYSKSGSANLHHPRSYSLTNNGDPKDFIDDFKLTAAMALIKWVTFPEERGKTKLISECGKIPLSAFKFATDECTKALKKAMHEDIDCEIKDALEYQWNQFLEQYYRLVHLGNHFKSNGLETESSLMGKAKDMLENMDKYFPTLTMDGFMNIWILKPVNGCRGQGIHICRTLQYILKVIKANTNVRYVIQKYIEKPLLIFNTKFDIRQWFLISSTEPLTIWIYRECYLRFSSQTYNLRKLHESIHLTNNSVQCRYNIASRDVALPDYNMWDARQFKNYLSNIGYPHVFNKIIYPGMKESITAAILMNQDNMSKRHNSFELYGADFMLTEDFKPWLLEINSRPAMGATTPITAKMCPQVLDDLIKVIIDVRKNPKAKTGNFELLYKQRVTSIPKVVQSELKLRGTRLPTQYFLNPNTANNPPSTTKNETSTPAATPTKVTSVPSLKSQVTVKKTTPKEKITAVSKEMRVVLENLLTLIQTERQQHGHRGGQHQNESNNKTPPTTPQDGSKESVVTECQKSKPTAKNEKGDIQEIYVHKRKSDNLITEKNSKIIVEALNILKAPEIKTSAMRDVVKLLSKIAVKTKEGS